MACPGVRAPALDYSHLWSINKASGDHEACEGIEHMMMGISIIAYLAPDRPVPPNLGQTTVQA
jgi:hypothetical protein